MKVNLEKLSQLERRLNIEVPIEKVSEAFDRVYKYLQKQVTVKGFRKGKTPLQTIRTMYKDRVREDVIKDLVETHFYEALRENSLFPLGEPSIEFDQFNESEPFKFSAQFEIRPEVELKKYEGLSIEKEILEVDEKEVEKVLERMQTRSATEAPLIEIRPAAKGDLATIDFDGFVDGQPLQNGAAKQQTIELGNSGFIPGFDDGIIGMNVGETKSIHLTFPEDYPQDLASKPVEFKITLQRLGKKSVPELNDEFASKFGDYKNLEELKNAIREDMKKSEEQRVKKDLKSRALKALVEANPIEIPPNLLKKQKAALIEDIHHKMEEQGMSHEQFEEYVKKWDADFEQSARFMIASSFLITELSNKLNLSGTEEDVDQRLMEYSKQTGIDIKSVEDFYNKGGRRSNLMFQITEEKVVDYIISKADLKELPKSQITPVED